MIGMSKMVHIYQAENFYECDYYTPSGDGFQVFDTPFGRIGIVICFDRHIPTSIRSCARTDAYRAAWFRISSDRDSSNPGRGPA